MSAPIQLATQGGDNRHWTPEQCLEDALADLRSGKRQVNRIAVLFLDDTGGGYTWGYSLAQLSASQLVALCEAAKTKMLQHLVP